MALTSRRSPLAVPIIKSLTFDGLLGLPALPGDKGALWLDVIYLANMQICRGWFIGEEIHRA